ncbi:MAG: metallophosphoesterase [Nitrososphaeraceae archaeon]
MVILNNYGSITELHVFNTISSSLNYYIAAVGDWGSTRNNNCKKTTQLMIGNKVNLSLGLGDYSYGSANEFEPVVDALKKAGIPMKGTEGNHDHDSSSYAELFEQPSMLYAFNAGPARIVILNTEDSIIKCCIFRKGTEKDYNTMEDSCDAQAVIHKSIKAR